MASTHSFSIFSHFVLSANVTLSSSSSPSFFNEMEATSKNEVVFELPPLIKIYKDGTIERLIGTEIVPPSQNPDLKTGVSSKDVVIDLETSLSARLYLPKTTTNTCSKKQLPLLIYFHGGAFIIGTPSSPIFHNFLNSLVAESNVVAVSVHYRRAPEHPVPIAHEDSWVALKWVLSHSNGDGSESWLNTHVDFDRVFLAGDTAGANICHNMAIRAGISGNVNGVKIFGMVLIQPFFWGIEPVGSERIDNRRKVDQKWIYVYPSAIGLDDPLINPANDPNLSRLDCKKILVCVAEKDVLRERGWFYYETLKKTGWKGDVEIMETEGEDHVFHLFNPTCEKAVDLMKKIVSFLKQEEYKGKLV